MVPEILRAMNVKNTEFGVVTPCSVVGAAEVSEGFGVSAFLVEQDSTQKTEAA
jgi:hypothetical protein